MRKLGKDGNSFTPTEQRKKNELMRQFMKRTEQYADRDADAAYRAGYDLIDWGRE